ncbi:MAG: trigger factor [bacterium]|nr:trigger factor [bacterium]
MQTKVDKLKQSKVKLVVTFEPGEMIKYFDHAYHHLSPSVTLQGFRPGKAPRALVESNLGVTRILSHALDDAVNESYQKALVQEKLNPISAPAIKINQYPNYGETVEEIKNGFEYEAEFTVLPEIVLGDYSKLKVDKSAKEAVKTDDVQKILDNLQKQKASFTAVDRPAKMGDLAEINFDGSVKYVKIDGMSSKHHPVVLGEKTLIPGFEEEVVGMKKGEKRSFKIKFPKDYHAKNLAGKEADFDVELLELKEVNLPAVDDTFAADFGHKTVVELKKAIESNLALEYEQKNDNDLEQKVLDKILPLVKADIPDEMTEKEIDRMVTDYRAQMQKMGVNFETYLSGMKKTEADMRKEMRDAAVKNIKVGLLLGKIIEEQKIDHHNPDAGKLAIQHLVDKLTS